MTSILQDHEDCTSSIIMYIPFFKGYHRMNNWFPFLFSLSTGRNQDIFVITSCQHLAWTMNPAMLNQHRLNAVNWLIREKERVRRDDFPVPLHSVLGSRLTGWGPKLWQGHRKLSWKGLFYTFWGFPTMNPQSCVLSGIWR